MNKLHHKQESIDRWIKNSSGAVSQKQGEAIYNMLVPKPKKDNITSNSVLKKIKHFTKDTKVSKRTIDKEAVKKIKEKPKSLRDSLKIGASSSYKPKTVPNGTHLNITV